MRHRENRCAAFDLCWWSPWRKLNRFSVHYWHYSSYCVQIGGLYKGDKICRENAKFINFHPAFGARLCYMLECKRSWNIELVDAFWIFSLWKLEPRSWSPSRLAHTAALEAFHKKNRGFKCGSRDFKLFNFDRKPCLVHVDAQVLPVFDTPHP